MTMTHLSICLLPISTIVHRRTIIMFHLHFLIEHSARPHHYIILLQYFNLHLSRGAKDYRKIARGRQIFLDQLLLPPPPLSPNIWSKKICFHDGRSPRTYCYVLGYFSSHPNIKELLKLGRNSLRKALKNPFITWKGWGMAQMAYISGCPKIIKPFGLDPPLTFVHPICPSNFSYLVRTLFVPCPSELIII
jgi:hypothetical protein